MATAQAQIGTERGSRYLQQLCKHWQHKLAVSFTPDAGAVDFGEGTTLAMAATANTLALTLNAPAPEQLAHMQGVVDNHLLRFAHGDSLQIDWHPAT